MAAVDRIDVRGIAGMGAIPNDIIKSLMNRAIWDWYNEHKDEVVIERKVWFIKVTLRIRDLRFLIERIAGKEGI